MDIRKKIKNKWIIIGGVMLFIVVWGIYQNPDRKTEKVNAELQQIITSINSTMQQVKQAITENKTCFSDESVEEGKSAECVINIRNIQDIFRTADKANIERLEKYYQANQSSLDTGSKQMIENSMKLYKSDSYSSLMSAYDQYFSAYIEWHKYFRDYVGIKSVDNMTSAEIMKAKTLAQDVVSTEENLKLRAIAFTDYLYENFSEEFVSSLTQLSTQ